MFEERRGAPRVKIENMVQIVLGKKKTIFAKANDISETGLSFTTQDPIEPDTDLEAVITLDNGNNHKEVINCKGRQIYCCEIEETYKSGMDFEALSVENRKKIKSFIESDMF